MVEFKASKLTIPNPSSSSSSSSSPPASSSSNSLSQPHTLSLLYEPNSLSLALFHSDSSLSLYSPFSLPSLPSPLLSPQALIPPPSSSSTFLLLHHHQNPNNSDPPHVLFVVSGPHKGGSQILLRFYMLNKSKSNKFVRARVVCNQKGLSFDPNLGVLVDSRHGFSVRISGSVNFFAMYSVSNAKIWVFSAKAVSDEGSGDDGFVVKLMKCGVIECCKPLYSIRVSFGLLVLGEENGVRVVNLRSFAKGSVRKVKNLNAKGGGRSSRMPNGVIHDGLGNLENGYGDGNMEGKFSKHSASGKQRFVKLKQERCGGDICFVVLKGEDVAGLKSKTMATLSRKAISIQPLSPNKFMVLDSAGDLYLLCLPKSGPLTGADGEIQLKRLPRVMKVQKLAYTPDDIGGAQAVWIFDGCHSMHMITGYDTDAAMDENNANDSEKNLIEISVAQAIFTEEKVQDVVSLTSNAVLVLGRGNLYAYSIP